MTPEGCPGAFVKAVRDVVWHRATPGGNTLNLNDPHVTWMPGGWVLTAAEAINDSGWIVGNGTYNGCYRAFVLVPQDVLLHGADRTD